MSDEPRVEESSWNLAQWLIMELADLLKRANNFYIKRQFKEAFFCMHAIRYRISANLLEEEMQQLQSLEEQINKEIILSKPADGFNNFTQENYAAINRLTKLYGTYNDNIMKSLKKYGYLIPPKEDKTNLTA